MRRAQRWGRDVLEDSVEVGPYARALGIVGILDDGVADDGEQVGF